MNRKLLVALLALFVTCVAIDYSRAEEAAADKKEAPAEAGAGGVKEKTVGEVWREGGWVMWALLGASIATVTLTAEGFFKLRVARLAPPALVAKSRELISSGNYQELWSTLRTPANNSYFSSVLATGLERVGRGRDTVEHVMQEVALKEATLIKTRNTYLSVVGVVTPMIGLTGTVVGMIKAFAVLGASGIADPGALSGKISEVLIATAGGLIVAIPSFIFYYILRNRALTVVIQVDSELNRLVDDIPYEELTGLRIGENFSMGQGGAVSGGYRKASITLTTNCPMCNAPIPAGTSPCPACGAVLEWDS